MSGTSEQRGPSPEARWLRENWNENALGRYIGHWIAVKGAGVEKADTNLDKLLADTIHFDPLYAFVHLEALQ